jgi:ribosome-associated heat shock protein Hsp15
MRIDRFLHCIRIVKSRTAAQALVEQGHIRVDGRRVLKCAGEVSVGQVIALPLRGTIRVLRVTALPARRGPPAEAREHYEDLDGSASN